MCRPVLPDGNPLGKRPHLRKAKGQIGTRLHGGKDGLTKALVALLALQQGHGSPVGVHGLTIVPLEEVHQTQVVVRLDGRVAIPAGGGQGEGALAGRNGAVILASH